MAWDALSFNCNKMDIYFDITWPLLKQGGMIWNVKTVLNLFNNYGNIN